MHDTKKALTAVLVFTLVSATAAAELRKATLDAFNQYARLTEQRWNSELKPTGPFLVPDNLPAPERTAAFNQLRAGEVLIRHLDTLDRGQKINVPDGLIHHWVGVVFIPGASLKQTLGLAQDYDDHSKFYAPDVVRSTLLRRNGDDFQIFYRLKRRKVVTAVLDTNYDIHYGTLSPTRVFSRSYSTRVAEVADAGESTEHEKPVDDGTGFMWRLYTFWRFEQRDGGTYVQCEALSLSRDIPTGLGWMIGPFVQSVPRESLEFTLRKTREALVKH